MRRQWRSSRFTVMAGMVGLLAILLSAIWAQSPLLADEFEWLKLSCEMAASRGEDGLNTLVDLVKTLEAHVNSVEKSLPTLREAVRSAEWSVNWLIGQLAPMAKEKEIPAIEERTAKAAKERLQKAYDDKFKPLTKENTDLNNQIGASNEKIRVLEQDIKQLNKTFQQGVQQLVQDKKNEIQAENTKIDNAKVRKAEIATNFKDLQGELDRSLKDEDKKKIGRIAAAIRERAKFEADLKEWQKKKKAAEKELKDTLDYVKRGKVAIAAARDCIKELRKRLTATTTTTTTSTTTTLRPTTTSTTTTTTLRPTTTSTTTTTLRPTTTTTTTTTLRPTTTSTTTTTLPPPPPPPAAKLTVSVLDEATRRPVPNMRVDLTPLVGWKTFLRGPDRMVFEGLPPDSYLVTAEAEGYSSGSDRVTVTEQRNYAVVIWLKKEEAKAPTPRLTARLDCGGLMEVVPGEISKTCNVIVEGWASNSVDPVEVVLFPSPPPGGIQVVPGNTSTLPANMFTAGVTDQRQGEYRFSEGISAAANAPPGTTPFQIVVRQRGAGMATVPLTVIVLPKKGGPVGPAPGGAPGGPGVPGPMPAAAGGQLGARLECGGVLEVVPGQVSKDCDVILEGWSRSSSERVEVELVYPRQTSGIEVTPGNTSAPPENMWPNSNNEYLFGEGFSARPNAPAGTTPIMVRVRQRGAGEVMLSLNVTVLPKKGGPFEAVPAPAGGLGGAGLPAPTPAGTSGQLSAELDCGGSFELAPGAFDGRNCGIIVRGWRSNTTDRVEVEVVYPRESSGIEASPGNTSQDPGNMYSTSASDYYNRYVFSQTFRAKDNAPPGVTPIRITVRQRGTGQINLTLNVAVLRKGQLAGSGPGIRPPATVATGSGGEYCVWRYKLFGDPPACFHFAAAACGTPRYANPSYELVGSGMKWSEADARIEQLSRYFKDEYGCGTTTASGPTGPTGPSDGEGGTPYDPTDPGQEPLQPGTDGPLDVPVTVTPDGPTDGQPPGGGKPPKKKKPKPEPPVLVVPLRPPTTTTTLPRRPPPIVHYWCKNPITGALEPSFKPCAKSGPIVRGPKLPLTPPTTLPPRTTPPTTLPPRPPLQPLPPLPPGDLSGTWHATYQAPFLGDTRYTMSLVRVADGKWQGPLDFVYVSCPELNFKTQATLQVTGVGKVRLTYNTPAKECPRYVGKIGAGAQQADGTYTNSQITFGVSPNTVTYTRK